MVVQLKLASLTAVVASLVLTGTHAVKGGDAVKAIDDHYQAVFHDFELTKPRKFRITDAKGKTRVVKEPGMLGIGRMDRFELLQGGHGIMGAELGHDKSREAAMKAIKGWRNWDYLFGNKTHRLTAETAQLSGHVGWDAPIPGVNPKTFPSGAQALKLAKEALDSKSGTADATHGKWLWAARPIKFTDKRCLSCHSESKLGDTAGVLVYVLHPITAR